MLKLYIHSPLKLTIATQWTIKSKKEKLKKLKNEKNSELATSQDLPLLYE